MGFNSAFKGLNLIWSGHSSVKWYQVTGQGTTKDNSKSMN